MSRRIVRAVGVDEDDDVAVVAASNASRSASPLPWPLSWMTRAPCSTAMSRVRSLRVAVDDQDLVGVRLHRVDDLADQPFFILGWDDNGDARIGHRSG